MRPISQHWKEDFTERVTFVEGDFFKEIPVKNYDIYYVYPSIITVDVCLTSKPLCF